MCRWKKEGEEFGSLRIGAAELWRAAVKSRLWKEIADDWSGFWRRSFLGWKRRQASFPKSSSLLPYELRRGRNRGSPKVASLACDKGSHSFPISFSIVELFWCLH